MLDAPFGRGRLGRKAVAGQRRDHEVIVGRQRFDDVEKFQHRPRPAVGQDQRARRGIGRPDVQEMHVEPVDRREIIGQRVQPRFDRAPVIAALPIGGEFLCIGKRNALVPVAHRFLFGPARARQPVFEVVERRLRHIDREAADIVDVHKNPLPCRPRIRDARAPCNRVAGQRLSGSRGAPFRHKPPRHSAAVPRSRRSLRRSGRERG